MAKFEVLQDLCPAGVIGKAQAVEDASHFLATRELKLIDGAHENRIRGFSTARKLAKSVLDKFNLPVEVLGTKADRTPDWPDQILGSISHHEQSAGVVVGRRSPQLLGLGLDLEIFQELHPNFPERIMTPAELENSSQHSSNFSGSCLATFCLKEATYKAMLEFNNQGLSFQDVEFSGWKWDDFFVGEIQNLQVGPLGELAGRLPEGIGLRARAATHGEEVAAVVWAAPV